MRVAKKNEIDSTAKSNNKKNVRNCNPNNALDSLTNNAKHQESITPKRASERLKIKREKEKLAEDVKLFQSYLCRDKYLNDYDSLIWKIDYKFELVCSAFFIFSFGVCLILSLGYFSFGYFGNYQIQEHRFN